MAWDDLFAIPAEGDDWHLDLATMEMHVRARWADAHLRRGHAAVSGEDYLRFQVPIEGMMRRGGCFEGGGIVLSDGTPAEWVDTLTWYLSLLPAGAQVLAMTEHNQNLTPIPDHATPTQVKQIYERLVAET